MKKQYQMKSNWPPVSGHSALLQKRLAKGVLKVFLKLPFY